MSSASSPRAEAPSHGAVHAQSTALVDENDVPIVPPWLRHYNRVISRKPVIPPSVGPSACSVCCTFFSVFGALFLFSVAAMMRANYRYVHIDASLSGTDLPGLSSSVSYAAMLYLIMGLVAMCYWSKGNAAKRDAELAAQVR